MDFSHVTAAGGSVVRFVEANAVRTRDVHVRDPRPGDIHVSVDHGVGDFAGGLAALRDHGYTANLALELETRDPTGADRPNATLAAAEHSNPLL